MRKWMHMFKTGQNPTALCLQPRKAEAAQAVQQGRGLNPAPQFPFQNTSSVLPLFPHPDSKPCMHSCFSCITECTHLQVQFLTALRISSLALLGWQGWNCTHEAGCLRQWTLQGCRPLLFAMGKPCSSAPLLDGRYVKRCLLFWPFHNNLMITLPLSPGSVSVRIPVCFFKNQ